MLIGVCQDEQTDDGPGQLDEGVAIEFKNLVASVLCEQHQVVVNAVIVLDADETWIESDLERLQHSRDDPELGFFLDCQYQRRLGDNPSKPLV